MDEEEDSKLMPYVVCAGIIIIPTVIISDFFGLRDFGEIVGYICAFYMLGVMCTLCCVFLPSIKLIRDIWPFDYSEDTNIILGYVIALILFIIGLSR